MATLKDLPLAPADAILGLTEDFKRDPNPQKINLGVGVYKDSAGRTPVLESVQQAEKALLTESTTRNYLPIDGDPAFRDAVIDLVFGESWRSAKRRIYSAHTPGGTGALRVTADFIKFALPGARVWLTNPTWPNHPQVFQAAGLEVSSFPWFDSSSNSLDFEGALRALEQVPAGDVVVLHGCCHNPTGADPSPSQWRSIASLISERGLIPVMDFAYQGFGDGLEEDAEGVRAVAEKSDFTIICSSFSKNFGLYSERVGAVSFVAPDEDAAARIGSQVKRVIRANYSNPPEHGGAIVRRVLTDDALASLWRQEVAQMRSRINNMRSLFVETLREIGVRQDFSFIENQKGMFSFSGLTKPQVEQLKERHSIYIVGSGRISVAGMSETNMNRLCNAIADVLGS